MTTTQPTRAGAVLPGQRTAPSTAPAPAPAPAGRLVRAVRTHPVAAFLAWFATVGQTLAFAPVVLGSLPTGPFLVASTLLGLLLPAVLITWVVDGPAGLRDLWTRTVRLRVPGRWYALAVLGVPAATLAVTVALTGPPPDLSAPALGTAATAGLVLQLGVALATINLWEEVAWTGFVQARLRRRHGPLGAAARTGVPFALGHVALVVHGSPAQAGALLLLLVVVGIPFRYLQGWVHERTGSLLVVGLVHAAGNAAAVGSVLGAGLLPRLYGVDGQSGLAFALLGLVVLAATAPRRRR